MGQPLQAGYMKSVPLIIIGLLCFIEASAPDGESDMDLDLLAESDTDNDSVHGGSVHSVEPFDEGSNRTGSHGNNHHTTSSEGKTVSHLLQSYYLDQN